MIMDFYLGCIVMQEPRLVREDLEATAIKKLMLKLMQNGKLTI